MAYSKHNPAPKRAVIFDFDGTIADSFPAVLEVFEDVTRQPQRLTQAQIRQFRNLSAHELMEVFKVPRWKIPYLFFRGRRMLRSHMGGVKLHAGIEGVIKKLHADSIPLYIVSTNSNENIAVLLKKYAIEQYFIQIYGNASAFAKARKLYKLIDTENIDVNGSWYVGDETRDVTAARAVGLHIASVAWGYNGRESLEAKQPDSLADTPAQLLKTLETTWKK